MFTEKPFIELNSENSGYVFLEVIGHGGYAQVFKVRSLKFDKIFAAKVMLVDPEKCDQAWESFDSEVSALRQLDHPHIIRLYDYFRIENKFCLILEFCPGGSVWDKMQKEGPLKGQRLYRIIVDTCLAVAHAHVRGLAHRDLKPHNLLLDEFGRVKLADFGISLTTDVDQALCRDYRCTMSFGAPEVLEQRPHDPLKADVWSLGVTILSLMHGTIPWHATSLQELENQIEHCNYVVPDQADPDIMKAVRQMVIMNPLSRLTLAGFIQSPLFADLKRIGYQAPKVNMDLLRRKTGMEGGKALPASLSFSVPQGRRLSQQWKGIVRPLVPNMKPLI